MRITCYSLILGARNTPTAGRAFLRRDDERIRDITRRHFPEGFTILNANGGWFDPARAKFVEEESRQVLVCPARRGQVRAWCDELAVALKQKEFLVLKIGPAVSYRPRGARRNRAK